MRGWRDGKKASKVDKDERGGMFMFVCSFSGGDICKMPSVNIFAKQVSPNGGMEVATTFVEQGGKAL